MYRDKDNLVNAFQEIVEVLAENGKEIYEIEWVATRVGTIDVNFFLMICEGTFYLNPSPCGSINPYLIIVGKDFWFTREPGIGKADVDYWCYHSMPQEPGGRLSMLSLFKTYPKKGKSI